MQRRPAAKKPKLRAESDWRKRSPATSPRLPIVIIGYGRTGGALGSALRRAKWPVSVFSRSGESLRRAVAAGLPIADHDTLKSAAICLFTVPDDALAETVAALQADLDPGAALVHCAGALALDAFGSGRAVDEHPRGSFHPLVSISDADDALEGCTVALSATHKGLLTTLYRMATDLRLQTIEVADTARALYHAGAVLAAGGATALLDAAVTCLVRAGVEEEDAVPALVALLRSALRGVDARGISGALTGPVVRGDASVVKRHLESLEATERDLYRQLSLRALSLVSDRLAPDARKALEKALKP